VKRLLVVVLCVVAAVTFLGKSGQARATSMGPIVTPNSPGAMAESSSGTLYLVDAARDQILRRLRDGEFHVVAGNGRRGFTGDGGAANNAEIAVNFESGLAVAPNGTVYFADSGNGRIREILANGVIETVAGGGSTTLNRAPIPALKARFGRSGELNGVTFGPNGELYVATNGVYRLDNGVLRWVVGSVSTSLNEGFRGFNMNPAAQEDFDPAYTLAFDKNGDLLVGGGETWGLYEMRSSGSIRFVQEDRGEPGLYRAMAATPNGDVVLAGGVNGFSLFQPPRLITWIAAARLSRLLPRGSHFAAGQGVAVGPSGAIFLDTDANNGFSSVSAIVEITPAGRDVVIWKS
jgi:hypothetical protein